MTAPRKFSTDGVDESVGLLPLPGLRDEGRLNRYPRAVLC